MENKEESENSDSLQLYQHEENVDVDDINLSSNLLSTQYT